MVKLINADLQSDGTLIPNPSATSGTVYLLVALDDKAATAVFNKDKDTAKWDRTMLAQATTLLGTATAKMQPQITPAQKAAQEKALAERAKQLAAFVVTDEVP